MITTTDCLPTIFKICSTEMKKVIQVGEQMMTEYSVLGELSHEILCKNHCEIDEWTIYLAKIKIPQAIYSGVVWD